MRNCRPLMVTLTWDIRLPRLHPRTAASRSIVGGENAPDGFDRLIDALRYLPAGSLVSTRACGCVVEFAGQAGAIGIERLDVRCERFVLSAGTAPLLGRRLQRFECQRKPPARHLDRIGLAHFGHPRGPPQPLHRW